MIKEFEEMVLPITEFRRKMTQILESLVVPKIIMNRDKPQAVILPYEMYKKIEEILENRMDDVLVELAEDRLNDSSAKYIAHDEFWNDLGVE